jgi:tRNA A-37 threonylcarbamoyl transferase component Bud32
MLLAPGQSKALASIGKLYGGVLNKISISHSDLTNMQGFLDRDRSSFIEYALRDSLISLIHAS